MAMAAVIKDPALAKRLAVGGRRLTEKRFNLRNNGKILAHLLESSARGVRRWSNQKLREKMGLKPLPDSGSNLEEQDVVLGG